MKILFFLLTTANIALLLWEYKQGAFNDPIKSAETITTSDQEPIMLASEIHKESKTQIAAQKTIPLSNQTSTPANPSNTLIHCYQVGPFISASEYKTWLKQLTIDADTIKPISKTNQLVTGYSVYYPAAETPDKTQENLRMLKERGASNFFLLNEDSQQGEITLGSFETEDKAKLMEKDMLTKNINVEIKPQYKAKIQQFVEIEGDEKLLEDLQRLKISYPQIDVTQCPAL